MQIKFDSITQDREVTIELPVKTTIRDLLKHVNQEGNRQVQVNGKPAKLDDELQEGDQVFAAADLRDGK